MPDGKLILRISTPDNTLPDIECDSLHLTISENSQGKGEGSYGIRKGHADAIISLAKGTITAFLGGKEIFKIKTGDGLADVKSDIITVIVDEISDM